IDAIRNAVTPTGMVRLCSCGYRGYRTPFGSGKNQPKPIYISEDQWDRNLQMLATSIGRTVCACPVKPAIEPGPLGCECPTNWVCKNPGPLKMLRPSAGSVSPWPPCTDCSV